MCRVEAWLCSEKEWRSVWHNSLDIVLPLVVHCIVVVDILIVHQPKFNMRMFYERSPSMSEGCPCRPVAILSSRPLSCIHTSVIGALS